MKLGKYLDDEDALFSESETHVQSLTSGIRANAYLYIFRKYKLLNRLILITCLETENVSHWKQTAFCGSLSVRKTCELALFYRKNTEVCYMMKCSMCVLSVSMYCYKNNKVPATDLQII